MVKISSGAILVFNALVMCLSCNTKEPKEETTHCPCIERKTFAGEENFVGIANISFDNYPFVDGSTSASILNSLIGCISICRG